MNLRVPQNAGKFLCSCTIGGFSRRAQLHEWMILEKHWNMCSMEWLSTGFWIGIIDHLQIVITNNCNTIAISTLDFYSLIGDGAVIACNCESCV
jgi:hypothetical protein